MSQKEIDRKVAIILATDVVNYSKHMEKNEAETVKNLRACESILKKLIKQHEGRLFNTGGDSFFIEFSSAVEAVECAVTFQKQIGERNKGEKVTVPLQFRIGVNMGDVIKEKSNLLGDGVNIAARLEALAQTNGVTISKNIYDLVKTKTSYSYNDLGIQKIKKNEFHAYDILLEPSQKRKLKSQKPKSLTLAAAAVLSICTILGVFFINQTDQSKPTAQISSLNTILVYPFKNNSSTDAKDNLSEALTESMIGSLSKYKGIKILSSSTSFYAKENNLDSTEISEELGVNYIVRGSIQTFGNESRINLELNDAKKDTVVWSDNIDFEISDIFKVQDKMGNEILNYLQVDLVTGHRTYAEILGTIENLTMSLNARNEWRKFTLEGNENFNQLIDELAKRIGDNNPYIQMSRAWSIYQKLRSGWSKNREGDLAKLDKLLDKVLASDLRNRVLHFKAMVELTFFSKDCEIAKEFARQAVELASSSDAYTGAGFVYFMCKEYDLAIDSYQNGLILTPNDNGWFITRYLVPSMYRAGYNDQIKEVLTPIIDATDMPANLLAYYAFVKVNEEEYDTAKQYFDKAKSKGLSKKYLTRYEMDEPTFKDFAATLNTLGEIP
jgi:TolB-like protein/class 3 adenylate cyclase